MTDTPPPAKYDPLATTASQTEVKQRRTMKLSQPARPRRLIRYGALLLLLVIWELYGRSVNPIVFTYPTAVAEASVDMVADGTLTTALGQTSLVLAIGGAAGIVFGVALGLLMGRSWIAKEALDTPVNALYALPAVALVPVIVLWFGFGDSAKIFVVAFFVFFPVVINTTRGVQEVDSELLEVTRSFCSPERRVWRDLLIPASLPYVFTGVKLAIGRGLVGVIVAEFFTAISGLGNLIVTNANTFQTARMFVPIVVLSLIGVILTGLLGLLERQLTPWRRGA
ncbi:MAG TPA: ABC transporter permease [Candidatus Ruania gallistercoris]|uniref:ABC transporter permease n=1 Tax=Candidatus Ruania gallistercoris TaxID=2838746 RepID=A0A9D2EGR3_9MICO|nr:ABC transporter permease [Candidatus Ruania gallistercoris]